MRCACGESRLLGMTLPGNCVPLPGAPAGGIEDVHAVRAEVAASRAAAVGTVSSFEPPMLLRVPW